MKSIFATTVILALTLGACKSSDSHDSASQGSPVACICGQPEAAIDGCAHPLCLAGKSNPDEPDCVCGPIEISNGGN